ncbi:hypothetical protein BGW39_006330 [Mortierella sp. 14UC]|nr:hypothetical protein BGW39_006330 [Mortierella sp. 14UC]
MTNTTSYQNTSPSTPAGRPRVLSVGAGLASLTLAMILQNSEIPYEVFERAFEVKPLGSAMAFGVALAPLFNQCGIYDKFVAIGKKAECIQVWNEKCELEYTMDFSESKESVDWYGFGGFIVTRPLLCDLILRQILKNRIHMSKNIISTVQDSEGVMRCRLYTTGRTSDQLVRTPAPSGILTRTLPGNLYRNSC